MKLIALMLLTLLLASCSKEPEVLKGPFIIRDNIKYDQTTDIPITGRVDSFFSNGQVHTREHYKGGKLDGTYEEFWNGSGQLKTRYKYVDGKVEGLYERFTEFGQLIERYHEVDGMREGLYELYSNEPFGAEANVVMKGKYKDGKRDGYWIDESPVGSFAEFRGKWIVLDGTGFYENGVKVDPTELIPSLDEKQSASKLENKQSGI